MKNDILLIFDLNSIVIRVSYGTVPSAIWQIFYEFFIFCKPISAWKVSVFGVILVRIPAFPLNTERYSVFLHIQSKCTKIRNWKTSNTDTFHAVYTYKIYRYIDKEKWLMSSRLSSLTFFFWDKLLQDDVYQYAISRS